MSSGTSGWGQSSQLAVSSVRVREAPEPREEWGGVRVGNSKFLLFNSRSPLFFFYLDYCPQTKPPAPQTISAVEINTTHIGGEELSVPAVTGVMCHLIEHVLSEADLAWISPNLHQEQEHSAKKVTHGLGTNNFLVRNQIIFQYKENLVRKEIKKENTTMNWFDEITFGKGKNRLG